MIPHRGLVAALLLPAPALAQPPPLRVVASFTVLADMVGRVGGDRAAGRRADVPAPNGLGLEGWMERIAKAARFDGLAVVASRGVPARKAGQAHGHDGLDPHAWQDVANAKRYADNIRDGLAATDPGGRRAAGGGRWPSPPHLPERAIHVCGGSASDDRALR